MCHLKITHCTEILLFFIIIREHVAVFVPSWHVFKNSVAVQIGLLHWQRFTNSHFHFFITVESATTQTLLQLSERLVKSSLYT